MRTAARDASTRAAAALRSGFRSTASRNERVKLRVAEIADPVRHHGAAAMRAGPASRDLRAGGLRHDVRARWRIFQNAARKQETAGGNKNQGAAPSVHRLILSVRRRERRDV